MINAVIQSMKKKVSGIVRNALMICAKIVANLNKNAVRNAIRHYRC